MTEPAAVPGQREQGGATTLLVAIGNLLRRDDGVAAAVVAALGDRGGCETLCVQQLTVELAERMASAARVVFVDADPAADRPSLDAIAPCRPGAADRGASWTLSHGLLPQDLVDLARSLYAAQAEAWLCRVPARDLGLGEGLSATAAASVAPAAALLSRFLGRAAHPRSSGDPSGHDDPLRAR